MDTNRFENMLTTLAYHTSILMTEAAPYKGSMGIGYEGGPDTVVVEFAIIPDRQHPSKADFKAEKAPLDVWDQVWFKRPDGTWESMGNRCGGREGYAKAVAGIIAQAARELKQ